MKESEKNPVKKNDRRTKAQLIETLNSANNSINKKDKELNTCQKELKNLREKIEILNEQNKESVAIKAEMEKGIQDGEKQQRILEKQIRDQEKSIKLLKKELIALQQPNGAPREDIPSARTTFRIDFYPRQGHYQGKIIHSLTKDDRVFRDLDMTAIMDFISQHLPQLKEKNAQTQTDITQQKELSPYAVTAQADNRLKRFNELTIIPSGTSISKNIVQHGQPFQVKLKLDPSDIMEKESAPLGYKISIYAKCLEDGTRKISGEISGNISSANVFTTKVTSAPLPRGTYRLEAVAMLGNTADGLSGGGTYRESKLINIC